MMFSYIAEIRRLAPSSAEEGYPEKESTLVSFDTGLVMVASLTLHIYSCFILQAMPHHFHCPGKRCHALAVGAAAIERYGFYGTIDQEPSKGRTLDDIDYVTIRRTSAQTSYLCKISRHLLCNVKFASRLRLVKHVIQSGGW